MRHQVYIIRLIKGVRDKMKEIITIALICISIGAYAQYPPIPNLPKITLEKAGFNRDSINSKYKYPVYIYNTLLLLGYFINVSRSQMNFRRKLANRVTLASLPTCTAR